MKQLNRSCSKCGAVLRQYWLKDGECNACRNPELVVTALRSVEIILMPLGQFGKRSEIGKHVKPLTRADITNAIADAVSKGFETVYVYARQPSKAVNDFVQYENGFPRPRITWIPGGLSGRGGYLFELVQL